MLFRAFKKAHDPNWFQTASEEKQQNCDGISCFVHCAYAVRRPCEIIIAGRRLLVSLTATSTSLGIRVVWAQPVDGARPARRLVLDPGRPPSPDHGARRPAPGPNRRWLERDVTGGSPLTNGCARIPLTLPAVSDRPGSAALAAVNLKLVSVTSGSD